MRITFHGAAGSVTGSNHLVETEQGRFLIDCGMFQGPKELRTRNYTEFSFDPQQIDAVLLTHAHIDHSGLLPKLVRSGYQGPIYTTGATADLLEIMLYDSAHIQANDIAWENRRRKRKGLPQLDPLYEDKDVEQTLALMKKVEYGERFTLFPGVEVRYRDAGHIMGSSFIEIDITENGISKRLVASGDLGRSHQALIGDPEVGKRADLILMESTYGDRNHKTETDTNKEIVSILEQVQKDKGTLIIPAFAVGRTQEMLYRLFELAEQHKIPKLKVFVDSPMATKVTGIYADHIELYDPKTTEYIKAGKTPLEQPWINFTASVRESKAINDTPGPKLIISASGMCTAGRVLHHLKHNIWKSNTHVLFVGYQARGTLGRRIIEGAKKITILGTTLQVNAHIHTVGGLSAHADLDEMLAWLGFYEESKPEVFLVHGDPEACEAFSGHIRDRYSLRAHIPDWHESALITFQEQGLDIKMEAKKLEIGYAAERGRWSESLDRLHSLLERIDKGKASREAGLTAEIILEKINEAVDDVLAEYGSELKF